MSQEINWLFTIGDHLLLNVLNIPSSQPIIKTLHDFQKGQ